MLCLLIPFSRQFPPEIQDHIIDQLHDIGSLRSCALTCQAWHVRSRLHLLRAIHVRGPKQLDEICSFFRTHEPLRPLVRSVLIDARSNEPRVSGGRPPSRPTVPVSQLVCTPLLNLLPNLRCWELREMDGFLSISHLVAFQMHPSILTYISAHSYIESLCLYHLRFWNLTPLVGLITALPRLKHLICDNIIIERPRQSSVLDVGFGPAYHRKPTKLHRLVVRAFQMLSWVRKQLNASVRSALTIYFGLVHGYYSCLQGVQYRALSWISSRLR
ncbi:hypothetical protein K466DRAFT_624053 [Polyporus arcularius HHB13444]|uniref:F-box domain-containing protein n=1 Tax=Polyporus arcularius HHB13444 TaxID=1314778 RepID=A0A5C3PXK4_9APHY|nr:hypothetical protein K466DRAFT_624053 [Polyporus arcularius HHB13444]